MSWIATKTSAGVNAGPEWAEPCRQADTEILETQNTNLIKIPKLFDQQYPIFHIYFCATNAKFKDGYPIPQNLQDY